MRTKQTIRGFRPGHALMVAIAVAAAALLSACGGAEDAIGQELTAQQQREAAALKRAHALNADAMGKIKSERAGRQAQNN